MAPKKPGITLEKHREIGAELLTMYNLLLRLSNEFSSAYPFSGKKSRPHREIQKAIENNVQIRHLAEENMFDDVGGENFDKTIYFGSSAHGNSLLANNSGSDQVKA